MSQATETLAPLMDQERQRLRREAGLVQIQHFRRPQERAFTAQERDHVTILFGGLTWKHEELIKSVFLSNGYKCEIIPTPNVAAFQLGKEYGNNGQCNPTYFTVGNLVQHLQGMERQGLSRQEIIDNYVFFTAGSCGPCRFGMYEAEYRFALQNAGFDGFRVMLFQQNEGIKAASGEPGLVFSVDFGLGMLNALHLGDTINELIFHIRPYEVKSGDTDLAFREAVDELCSTLRGIKPFELDDCPKWLAERVSKKPALKQTTRVLGKLHTHLYGRGVMNALDACRERLDQVEVDRLRVKPIVKIIGEFWAQTTEGDGNFNMFRFLEREGAQVLVEPIATWIAYMIHQVRMNAVDRKRLNFKFQDAKWYEVHKRAVDELKFRQKWFSLVAGEAMWTHFYHRVTNRLGHGLAHHLVPQKELVRLAQPYYHKLARGGEGHLEVGKNVFYTENHLAHMVLALKPFGCMPSTQSDGAQSAVVNHYKDMIYLPIETSGEGEVNAHSRVQMGLGEAKAKAKAEFDNALKSTGKRLEDIRAYIEDHPELKKPFYHVPHRPGIAGTAAQFALHVSDRMNRGRRLRVAV